MHLGTNEVVVKIFYHHYLPFTIRLLKLILASVPMYALLFFLAPTLPGNFLLIAHLAIVIGFTLAVAYMTIVYWLDRLVLTNERIVFIDWQYLTKKTESEASLKDIQDIRTHERGFLASFSVFDYGTIEIKTASDKSVIKFDEIPDPEGVRKAIYLVNNSF